MGTQTVLRSRFPRLARGLQWPTDLLGRLGDHMLFYFRALAGVPHATVHFRRESHAFSLTEVPAMVTEPSTAGVRPTAS